MAEWRDRGGEYLAGVGRAAHAFKRPVPVLRPTGGIARRPGSDTGSERPHFMQKTKKSVAKRFKLSARGKLIRRTPGFRHLLGAKSTKSKRRATRDKLVAPGHAAPLLRCLPFLR